MRAQPYTQKPELQVQIPCDAAELRHNTSVEQSTVSPEYIERLILLTSRSGSWRATDEEAVDLTEPRFESFHVAKH